MSATPTPLLGLLQPVSNVHKIEFYEERATDMDKVEELYQMLSVARADVVKAADHHCTFPTAASLLDLRTAVEIERNARQAFQLAASNASLALRR